MQRPEIPIFGGWIVMFCEILGVTQPELADRAGVAQPTVSKVARGEAIPKEETVVKLWSGIEATANEQGWILDSYTHECFLNAGGCVSDQQKETSAQSLKMFANAVKSKRIEDALNAQIKKQEELIEAQKKEINELRIALRKEKNRTVQWRRRP